MAGRFTGSSGTDSWRHSAGGTPCRGAGSAPLRGDCPWLRAHFFVWWRAVNLGGAHWCRTQGADAQRTFAGYYDRGDDLASIYACTYAYGGDVLPPEAERGIFDRVLADFGG